jgi:hypothetical protein
MLVAFEEAEKFVTRRLNTTAFPIIDVKKERLNR